jgi:hypothetical protein
MEVTSRTGRFYLWKGTAFTRWTGGGGRRDSLSLSGRFEDEKNVSWRDRVGTASRLLAGLQVVRKPVGTGQR